MGMFSRQVFRTALVAVFLLLLAGGIAAIIPEEEPADLRVIDGVSITTLDPAAVSWLQDIRIITQLYEGLYVADPDGSGVLPGCAEWLGEATSDDGMVVVHRFRILPEARWSNGDPVTADDFVFAWRRAVEPGTARDYSILLDHIRGVRAYVAWRNQEIERLALLPKVERAAAARQHFVEADRQFADVGLQAEDEATLRVEWARLPAYWRDLLSLPVYLPLHRPSVELFRRTDDAGLMYYDPTWTRPGRAPYNGPFTLERWRFKRGLRLARNALYRDSSQVRLTSVEYLDVADLNTAWLMYEAGQADWVLSLDTSFAPELVARSSSPLPRAINHGIGARKDVHAFTTFGTYFYNFNCLDSLPDGSSNPFADARVRRAFVMAVDRETLCREVTRRGESPAYTLVPPGTVEGYPPTSGLAFDPPAARRLLAEAGWTDASAFPVVGLLYNNESNHGLIAQSVAAMWTSRLGVRVRLIGKESQSYRDDKRNQRFMAARASWYGDYEDPTSFLDVFRSESGNNDSAFRDPVYDDMLDRADAESQAGHRLAALAECESYLMSEMAPVLPLFHYVNIYAYNPSVIDGVQIHPRLLVFFKNLEVRR
jgi:oligopeptide transport system substrate-binding protein